MRIQGRASAALLRLPGQLAAPARRRRRGSERKADDERAAAREEARARFSGASSRSAPHALRAPRARPRAGCACACRSGTDCGSCACGSRRSSATGLALEQRLRPHDHPGDAVAALRRLLVDEGALHRARASRRVPRPSSVRDAPPGERRDRRDAREHRLGRPPAPCRRRTGRGRSRTWRRSAAGRRAARRGAASPDRRRARWRLAVDIEADHLLSSRIFFSSSSTSGQAAARPNSLRM